MKLREKVKFWENALAKAERRVLDCTNNENCSQQLKNCYIRHVQWVRNNLAIAKAEYAETIGKKTKQ